MKSTITPLAIHIMRMFSFSSSSWLVIDPSFFGSLAPVPFSTERGHYLPLILQPAYASDGLRVRPTVFSNRDHGRNGVRGEGRFFGKPACVLP
jgi:hypothetical protein